ncbi:MAG TPA: hypothetical protein VFK82_01785 [Burkholderiaceae bacterium]|nr:hypothetical protein [Burkholderiaceae bacterium]
MSQPLARSALLVEPPPVIAGAGLPGRPLDYEWGVEQSRAIRAPMEDEFPRLQSALAKIAARSGVCLMGACLEWVAWRMCKTIAVEDALARCEAVYACAREPGRIEISRPSEPFPREDQDFHGPLKLARMLASDLINDVQDSGDDLALSGWVLSSILLARHVTPHAHAVFDAWIEQAMRACARLGGDVDEPWASQSPISRACLFGGAAMAAAENAEALRAEMALIEQSANPYLRPPGARG